MTSMDLNMASAITSISLSFVKYRMVMLIKEFDARGDDGFKGEVDLLTSVA